MTHRSLLMKFGGKHSVRLKDQLLPDHATIDLDGITVFAGAPPWRAMHDLLVDPTSNTLAGIVYAVPEMERSVACVICSGLPRENVRYCISPLLAAEHLRNMDVDLFDIPRDWGSSETQLLRFPEVAMPYRQLICAALRGEGDPSLVPEAAQQAAGDFFHSVAEEQGSGSLVAWPGGDLDRIEVTWLNKPVHPKLPSYFSSALEVVLAQNFAEDIWFYRSVDGAPVAFGLNHLDRILSEFKLRLPAGLPSD